MSSTYSQSENSSTSHSSIDRKALKKPDRFLTVLSQFFTSLAGNSRAVLLAGIILVLGMAALTWAISHRDSKEARARNALFLAEKSLEKELKAIAATVAPPAKADPTKELEAGLEAILYKKLDADRQLSETVTQLKKLIEQFSGTRSAYEAQMTLGKLYADHGDSAQALPWLVRALGGAPTAFEKVVTQLAVGHVQEDLGKYREAAQDYEAATKTSNNAVKGDALLSLARVQELLHDTEKAKSVYDQIILQMPGTEYAKTAELRKSQIE